MPNTVLVSALLTHLLVASFTADAGPASADALMISGNAGGAATVEGVISEIHVAKNSGTIFIDMGGRYPDNRFTAVIWSEDADKFPNVAALYHHAVKITGPIRLYHGKPEIILRRSEQLQTQ